jgi:basic membrane lipoprotein Med (substrate-binding protein (PBP1-ABC) superfamily)/DNA-binding SARP family transcriptional activator
VTRCDATIPIVLRSRSDTFGDVSRLDRDAHDRPNTRFGGRAYHGTVRFEVLGPTRVVAVVGSGAPTGPTTQPSLGGPKQRLVLAMLLADPNRVVSVDRLVDGLWGERPPDTARHTVQSYVSELRKVLGSVIDREGSGYVIRVDADTLDILDFEARIAAARAMAPTDAEGAAAMLSDALALWRGAPFEDVGGQEALDVEVARLGELRLAAVEEMMQARLAAGRHSDIVADLDRLTREHPYREELRALHMVALYRCGRQADALRAFQRTRHVLSEDLGIVPSPKLRRLEEQILLQDPDLDAPPDTTTPGPASDRWIENPYIGLRAFREEDHARYFGQEQLVDRLLARVLDDVTFTAVVGPSGSGKSSAVQAGLIPRLRRDHPEIAIALMQPGAHPFGALDAALAVTTTTATGSFASTLAEPDGLAVCVREVLADGRDRLLIVVDQFEELFTLVDDGEARRFLDLVSSAAGTAERRVHVMATLRADFYDRPLADPAFGQLFADNVVTVVALGPSQLEAAATLPARQLDITVEPRLVGRLIADVAAQPNALPLFQYALTELFDARTGPVLDLATYERIGGVRKAIARRAESLYGQLDEAGQEVARQLFLRIATLSGDIVGRRRVPASELVSLDVDVISLRNVIDTFSRYRLLALDRDPATGSPTVEVAHEALLTEWHRLRDWIDQHRDDLVKQASFLVAVNEWEASGRDSGYLLQGTRLDDYRRWATTTQLRLTAAEHDFVTAAVAARAAGEADEADRERLRLRLQRRSRRQLMGLFAAAAALTGVIAYPIVTRPDDPGTLVAVLESPREDSLFDELVARGIETAADDLGFAAEVLQPPYTDLDAALRLAADGASVVAGSFRVQGAMLDIAGEFPDTLFALIDETQAPLPNTVAVGFAVEQGSYLVGAAAALESATGKIGYIGANASPHLESFRAGFEQGAVAADPGVEIVVDLVEPTLDSVGYTDVDIARTKAVAMYEQGVDVIFVAAGGSGMGDLSTEARPLWVVGVDSDQYYDISDAQRAHLLTSMFKRFEVGIRTVVAAYDDGTLVVPGARVVGLAEGAVGYTRTGQNLHAATITRLEQLSDGIVDGTIVVDPVPSVATDLPAAPNSVVVEPATGSVTPLPDVFEGVFDLRVSPDGQRLVGGTFSTLADRLTVADVDGGRATTLEPAPGRSHYAAEWSPDGKRIVLQERLAVGTAIGRIVVADPGTGRTTTLADFDDVESPWWWTAPAFTAGGAQVLFHVARDDSETTRFDTWAVPVEGGEPELIQRDAAFPVPLADGRIAVVTGMRGLFEDRGATISMLGDDGGLTPIVSTDGWIWQPALSPDGTRLAYVDTGSIRIVDLETGEIVPVRDGGAVEWLDDDRLIVGPDV